MGGHERALSAGDRAGERPDLARTVESPDHVRGPAGGGEADDDVRLVHADCVEVRGAGGGSGGAKGESKGPKGGAKR